jgi:hypothetical protein
MKPSYSSSFVLGRSGSGKTVAAAELLEAEGRPMHVVNGEPPSPSFTVCKWSEVLQLSKCSLLVDDLVSVSSANLAILQTLVNVNARHKDVVVILVCHSLVKNNIYSLMSFVTQVNFTMGRSNARSIGLVCDYFRVSKQQRDQYVETFLADKAEYGYYVFSTGTLSFTKHGKSGVGAPSSSTAASTSAPACEAALRLRETAENYVTLFCQEPQKVLAVYDFIVPRIPVHALKADLTLSLKNKGSGQMVQLSLLDYLQALNSKERPSRQILSVHAYVGKYVTLPRMFVQNRFLL